MSASTKKKLRKEQEALQLTEKQKQEKKESKKLKIYTAIFALIMVLVIGAFAFSTIKKSWNKAGITEKYSTAMKINNEKISAAELSYYYTDFISNYYQDIYEEYGNYAGVYFLTMGLDVAKPLDEQYSDTDKKVTWAEYFANMGMEEATKVYVLKEAANKAGHKLTADEKANVDATIDYIETFVGYGYEVTGYRDVADYLKKTYGNGASEKTYRKYLEDVALATSYYNAYAVNLEVSVDEIKAHNDKRADEYSFFTYSGYNMYVSSFYEGEKQADGSYTAEQKAAALKAAEEAAKTIENSKAATAEDLDKAIAALDVFKDDTSAKTTQSKDANYLDINETIRTWLAQEGRKAGDLGVLPLKNSADEITSYYVVVFENREDNNTNLVDARHILVSFEKNGKDSSGNLIATEADKAKAKGYAEDILAKFNATGKTEDDFAALVKDNSDDEGSVNNGGLYEDIFPGRMVTNFNDWCFAEGRKAGDTGIVESEHGYHVMYFVGQTDETFRNFMIDNVIRNENREGWLQSMIDSAKITDKDISKLKLDYVMAPSN